MNKSSEIPCVYRTDQHLGLGNYLTLTSIEVLAVCPGRSQTSQYWLLFILFPDQISWMTSKFAFDYVLSIHTNLLFKLN